MHHPSIIRDLNGRKTSSPTVDQVVDKALEAFSEKQLFRALINRGALGVIAAPSDVDPGYEVSDCMVVDLDAFKAAADSLLAEDGDMAKSIAAAFEDARNSADDGPCDCPVCAGANEADEVEKLIGDVESMIARIARRAR